MRTLVSGNPYPSGATLHGAVLRLVQITTDVQTHYWTNRQVTYAGHWYAPWLVMDEPVCHYRSLQVDSGIIKLQNADGQMETFLAAEKFEGAAVRVLDYFEAIDDAGELIRGILTERQANEKEISWRIIPAWDAQAVNAPPRVFSRTCTWRFKSDPCGYTTGGFSTCDKTYTACIARGRTHCFNGFLQVDATLEEVYAA